MAHNSEQSPFYLAHPKVSLLITAIVMVVALIGAQNLYFRGDYKVFFEEKDPQRLAFEEMQNTFNKSENVAFMIVPKSGNVYNTQTLNLAFELTEAAWQMPFSTRVESVSNYQNTYDLDGDLIVEDLILEKMRAGEATAHVQKVVESTPELIGRLASRDGRALVVNLSLIHI